MNEVETIEIDNYVGTIYTDDNPESPREWDNIGIMFCSHTRYRLGDEQIKSSNFGSWNEIREYLIREHEAEVILPLYMYDHSGITISVNSFNNRWDSGQIGFIIATKEDIKKNFGMKRISKKARERAKKILKSEVETYDMYVRGEVYGYIIDKKREVEITTKYLDTGEIVKKDSCKYEEVDSCWGYYGLDEVKEVVREIMESE